MGGAYVDFPFNVLEVFGRKGLIKVKAVFDHKAVYRGSLANMGTGCHILILRKDIRKEIGKSVGDTVHVSLEEDLEERVVVIPEPLAELFKEYPVHAQAFERLSFSHRREMVAWLMDAKKPETRARRLGKLLEFIEAKMKPDLRKQL